MNTRYLKFLIVLVIAAVLTAAFSGCKKKEKDTSLDDLNAVVSQYQEMLESAEAEKNQASEKQKIVVIIPAGCGTELFGGATFLCSELSKYVGYDIEPVYDCDFKKSKNDLEILIGATDRDQSSKYLKSLRTNDYGYEYRDGSLQIGAHSEALCARAINAFVDALVEGKMNLNNVNTTKAYAVRGEYDIEEIVLCGFPICEYDIVYSEKSAMSERALAYILRDKLSEYSGYSLRVINDKQCNESTRAICVGESLMSTLKATENEAVISVNFGNVELVSDKNAGIYYAIEKFVDLVKQSERNGKCNLELVGSNRYAYNGSEFSVCIVRDDFVDEGIDACANAVGAVRGSVLAVFDTLSQTAAGRIGSNLETLRDVGKDSYYYADDAGVRCIYQESVSLDGGGELITLIIERIDGNKVVFIGGFSNGESDSEELLVRLTQECEKYASLPLIVAHELSADLDRRFDDESSGLCAVSGAYGLYFSADKLVLKTVHSNEISNSLVADSLSLEFYYS